MKDLNMLLIYMYMCSLIISFELLQWDAYKDSGKVLLLFWNILNIGTFCIEQHVFTESSQDPCCVIYFISFLQVWCLFNFQLKYIVFCKTIILNHGIWMR